LLTEPPKPALRVPPGRSTSRGEAQRQRVRPPATARKLSRGDQVQLPS
jgi:hypothetical protein